MGVNPCSDCSSSQGKFGKRAHAAPNSYNSRFDLSCITSEFLAQTDGRGILEVSSSDFKNEVKFPGLAPQSFMELVQGGEEILPEEDD